MTTQRSTTMRATTALFSTLACTALIAACTGGGTEESEAPPAPAPEAGASDEGGAESDGGTDDAGTEEGDPSDDGGDPQASGGLDGEDEEQDPAGDGPEAPDPLPFDGYGPGTVEVVAGTAGEGTVLDTDQLHSMLKGAFTGMDIECESEYEIGAPEPVTCATGNDETELIVRAVNVSEGGSDLLVSTGDLPEEMIAEGQTEGGLTLVKRMPEEVGEDSLRDGDMVDAVNDALADGVEFPEQQVVDCRGAIGFVPAGDEYEFTAASCSGYVQDVNESVFRVATAVNDAQEPVLVFTISFV